MVTHEDDVAEHAKRVIRLKDGEVQTDEAVVDRKVFTVEEIEQIASSARKKEEPVS